MQDPTIRGPNNSNWVSISECKTLHVGKNDPSHIYCVDSSGSEPIALMDCERNFGVFSLIDILFEF